MGTINVYDNDADQFNALEGNVCFLDFEDDDDNI